MTPHEYPQETIAKAQAEGLADDDGPDFGSDAPPAFEEADRSTLQAFADCPGAARLMETGRVMDDSLPALAGQEVHEAFRAATHLYVTRPLDTDDMGPDSLADAFKKRLLDSRPDVMPRAIDAAWNSAFPWAKFLAGTMYAGGGINPKDIICYDGGEGDRSGQLSVDIPDLKVRLTSELDFLYQSPATAILREVDFKSGWADQSADVVAAAFQFWCHSKLVFANFPACNVLEVSVWETRRNRPSEAVTFLREDLQKIDALIRKAVLVWKEHRGKPVGEVPFWPERSKCARCPAARVCPKVAKESCARDPVAFIQALGAVEARRNAMRDEAAEYVDFTGHDIVAPNGDAFGRAKDPNRDRKPNAVLYSIDE